MTRMTVLTPDLGARGGGLAEAARGLARALHGPDLAVSVVAPEDKTSGADASAWAPLAVSTFAVRGPRRFAFLPALASALAADDRDVTHVHGLWTYLSAAAARHSRRTGRPFIVSPHGMLDPRARGRSRWRKSGAWQLYQGRALRAAACLHAVSDAERAALRALGLANPICLIPNGVALPAPAIVPAPWPDDARRDRVLLYLGRLHAKKGLLPFLEAWAMRPRHRAAERWRLVIAGWDDGEEARLRRRLAAGAIDGVTFAGPVQGATRDAAYANAHAFVLPSTSEGLPMAVLEAWSHALPALITDECNLPEGLAAGAALRLPHYPPAAAGVLGDLFALPDEERRAMGARGRDLVRARFGWEAAAREMRAVVAWLLGGGPRPASVSTA